MKLSEFYTLFTMLNDVINIIYRLESRDKIDLNN